ncbi:hypothetical protein Tco_0189313 [Tanacetum coccineum]
MMVSSWVTLQWPKLSKYSTSEDKKWKKLFMSHSVKMMKQFLIQALKEMKSTSMRANLSQMMSFFNPEVKSLNNSVLSEEPTKFTTADEHPAINEPDNVAPISDDQPVPIISPPAEEIL